MKRLQFRHHDEVFDNRQLALEFFANIANPAHTACTVFGTSLFAEPMVAKYYDANEKEQILLAIGVEGNNTEYHVIDSAKIKEDILANAAAILAEENRAELAESAITINLNAEIVRAKAAEEALSAATVAEQERAIAKENEISGTVADNVAKIHKVTASSSNVLEEYALKNNKGVELGERIKIYKDSALVAAQLGYADAKLQKNDAGEYIKDENGDYVFAYESIDESTEYLYLIYSSADGSLKLVGINFEEYLTEKEFGRGLEVSAHTVHVRIAASDEGFLKVDNFGVRTEGINSAINNAKALAIDEAENYASELVNAEKSERRISDGKVLASAYTYSNEKLIEAKNYTDAAKADAIASAKTYADAKDADLQAQIKANKVASKDLVVKTTVSGTSLEIQTDEITITKLASASTIYDSNVAVLGTLLKIKEVTPSLETIKAAYELQNANGVKIGDTIEIPKESALQDVKMGHVGDVIDINTGNITQQGSGNDTLNFIYLKANGLYELVGIEISKYFTDAHFGKGLSNQDNKISIVAGDGNEFLVIGDDTIAVTGVSMAILNSKLEAISSASTSSKAYTDQRINDVTGSISALSNTVNIAVESMGETVNTAVAGMNTTLSDAVTAMNTTVNKSIDKVNKSLNTEISNRESADTNLANQITALTLTYATKGELSAATAGLKEFALDKIADKSVEILSAYNAADAVVLASAKGYADSAATAAVVANRGNEVADVIYDSGNKKVQLKLKNGNITEGFDASDFLVDGVLDDVVLSGNSLVFKWNAEAGSKETSVELSKFANIYKVESGRTFINMSEDNTISLFVDGDGDFTNTLASTNFVKANASAITNSAIEALNLSETYDAKGSAAQALSDAKVFAAEKAVEKADAAYSSSIAYAKDVVSANTHTTIMGIESEIKAVSGSIVNYVNVQDEKATTAIASLSGIIGTLRADASVDGSIKNTVKEEIQDEVIAGGNVVTTITPEQATGHSLIRKIVVDSANGDYMYYASNDATDMWYRKPDNTRVILNDYIKELEAKVTALETNVDAIVKAKVKEYLTGVANEIKITEKNGKLEIGFADNAIFGPTE